MVVQEVRNIIVVIEEEATTDVLQMIAIDRRHVPEVGVNLGKFLLKQ